MPELQALDIALLGMILAFAAWGFANGFLRAVGAIIGLIIAAVIAGRFYLAFAELVGPVFGPYQRIAALASYAFIFMLVARLFGIAVMFAEKAFDLLSIIPFLKSINRIIGLVFGVLFGILFLGTLLYIIGKYSPITSFNDAAANSRVAQYLLSTNAPIRAFYPTDLLQLRSYF